MSAFIEWERMERDGALMSDLEGQRWWEECMWKCLKRIQHVWTCLRMTCELKEACMVYDVQVIEHSRSTTTNYRQVFQ